MKHFYKILSFILLIFITFSCSKVVEPTTVKVKDPNRHYYPIIRGQELSVVYTIENTGESPLVIRDVQSCCGCEVDEERTSDLILSGEKGYIVMKYNSTKNIGYVEQKIRVYGNISPIGMLVLTYDVNVVPDANYTHDYEELHKQEMDKENSVETLVDGNENQKGYYVNLE